MRTGPPAERPISEVVLDEMRGFAALARRLVQDLDRTRTLGLAAELAFWLFLALVPLAAVAGMVAAKLAVESDVGYQVLETLPSQVGDLIARELSQVAAWNGGAVGVRATMVFVWLASSGVHAIFDLLELGSGVRRPWWHKRLLALASCLVLSIGVALLAVLATGVSWISEIVSGVLPRHGLLAGASDFNKVARFLLGIGAAIALLAGLYWVGMPARTRHRRPIWPGAVLAVILELALGLGYALYISTMGVGSAYSAGLAVIGVTLIALYLFSLALLVGAQFNLTLSEHRAQKSR